jgi:hypothetical protein
MKRFAPLLGLILLWALPVAAQTPDAPSSGTTIVLPEAGAGSSATSPSQPGSDDTTVTKSQTGDADVTVTDVKRENGSRTTVITQQPPSSYQPMGQGGYQPMGR